MQEDAYEIAGEGRSARWLVSCDHASNRIPAAFGGTLGLPPEEMARHIAYDIGARGVALELARLLDAPAVLSRFSRLVIDPNRGEDDPTLVMKLYDGTIVPGNRFLDDAGREERKALCYRPYHEAYARLAAERPDPVICAVHSFTAGLRGRPPRPWHVGILHSHLDSRLAIPLIERLRQEPDLVVGDNQPYDGHLPGDAIDRHALAHGRPNVLLELRQDLIESEAGQLAWARRLAPILEEALAASGL